MSEPWDAAVAVAGDGPPADLSAAAAEELIALWSDLSQALRRAARQRWSVECDGLVVRIVMLSRLTGATPWQHVPALRTVCPRIAGCSGRGRRPAVTPARHPAADQRAGAAAGSFGR